ncbi:MAG TPA: ATP-binding cassette domain-containing protein [Ilumatobacter sp.]|nr:ATP-binding cassette domain-containing protein [Ilumatobacter sp.]
MSAVSLSVERLTFCYPGREQRVLDELSLQVPAGERLAVLGPNGSGKTTFALHLNGLLDLQAGRITVDGLELSREHLTTIRRTVGTVFQDPDDMLFMQTVRDDVGFGPANLGIDGHDRDHVIIDALRSVGADALIERTPHHLSGGEKRRVALATVLAMTPGLLVLDEPTSGLDPRGRRELAELLSTLDQTQLIITHDLPFALATCERAVILSGGRIVADDTTRALLADTALLETHRLELPFGYQLH